MCQKLITISDKDSFENHVNYLLTTSFNPAFLANPLLHIFTVNGNGYYEDNSNLLTYTDVDYDLANELKYVVNTIIETSEKELTLLELYTKVYNSHGKKFDNFYYFYNIFTALKLTKIYFKPYNNITFKSLKFKKYKNEIFDELIHQPAHKIGTINLDEITVDMIYNSIIASKDYIYPITLNSFVLCKNSKYYPWLINIAYKTILACVKFYDMNNITHANNYSELIKIKEHLESLGATL